MPLVVVAAPVTRIGLVAAVTCGVAIGDGSRLGSDRVIRDGPDTGDQGYEP